MKFLDTYKYYLISGGVFLILLLVSLLSVGYIQYNALQEDFTQQTELLEEKNKTISAISENQKFQREVSLALDQLAAAQREQFGKVDNAISQLKANDAQIKAFLDSRIPSNLSGLLESYYRKDRPELSSSSMPLSSKKEHGAN